MGKETKIQWCDHTFNPWIGCTKVSAGCGHCYAAAQDKFRRWTPDGWGKGKPRRRTSVAYWRQPQTWNLAEAAAKADHNFERDGLDKDLGEYIRSRVFCASLADWLDAEVPAEWLSDLLNLIRLTPNLDWLLLTKRPELWRERMAAVLALGDLGSQIARAWLSGDALPNIWVGTSVEDQSNADRRIPQLITIPARVRFLSMEPLLGRVSLPIASFNLTDTVRSLEGLHWVIIGGESGPGARPFVTEHAWEIVLDCQKAGVPVFVKQLGSRPQTTNANAMAWPDDTKFVDYSDMGIAAAGVLLRDRGHGSDVSEWPDELLVQQWPEVQP